MPTDTTTLQQLVRDMAAVIDAGEVVAKQQVITESKTEIDRLRLIIRQFQRARFGRSAERLDLDQMAFGLEELESDRSGTLDRSRGGTSQTATPGPVARAPAADRDHHPCPAHRSLPGLRRRAA